MNIVRIVNKHLLVLILLGCPFLLLANNKYVIDVELEPAKRSLNGTIQMSFTNTTEDTLQEIWVHLWPNAYSSHHTPLARQMLKINQLDFHYGQSLGRIDSLNFNHQGKAMTFMTSDDQPDVGVLLLDQPLAPGKTIQIQTPFRVKLPEMVSRSGYSGSFYAATQWYPKFAVYEAGDWQSMSYLEQGEFYSDFADYDVKVTLPSAYDFAASGYRYVEKDTSLSKITYEVQLSDIHDFAWFASRKFDIKQEVVTLTSGKEVLLQSYVHDEEISGAILEYAAGTLKYMSEHLGEYPYDVCTVVQGVAGMGNGMEYPTICTVDGGATIKQEVVHEVIHNWWYGILANNERKEPFLDESVTSYYENRVIDQLFPEVDFDIPMAKYFGLNRLPKSAMNKNIILNQYRTNSHQALNLESEEYSLMNYFSMIYAKGAIDIQNLSEYLGVENFDKLMQSFYEKYKFKHISIDDLQQHFEESTHVNTKWFFEDVLKTTKLSDLSIKKVSKDEDRLTIILKNKGSLGVPAKVALVDKDLKVLDEFITDIVTRDVTMVIPNHDDAYAVLIDPQWLIPESNRKNNFAKINGIQKINPLQVRFLGSVEDPTKNQLFLAPVLAGNKYDGFMLGMAIYNSIYPVKKLEYELVPFYAFKSKQFNWIGNVSYHISPASQKPIDIKIGLHSKSFSINNRPLDLKFIKLEPFIEATFKKLSTDNGLKHKIGYRNVQIWNDGYSTRRDSITNELSFSKVRGSYNTHELWYALENNHVLFPHYLKTIVRFDKDYLRQTVEYKQKFRYSKKGAFFHMRLFAGAFYYKNSDVSFRLNSIVGLNMSGINGRNDYLYDGAYLGRNMQEGFTSRQMMMGEGNFKVMTALQNPPEGKTVNGLFAANFKLDAPIKWLPIQLFFDLGYSVDKVIMPGNLLPVKQFHYDMGFSISLLNEGLEIYFPLLMSENYRTYYKSNLPKFGQRITFAIDINKINFRKRVNEIVLKSIYN